MASLEGDDGAVTTETTETSDYVIDLRGPEPVIDLRDDASRGMGGQRSGSPGSTDEAEHRQGTQRARFIAVLMIALLNVLDIITTYVAISFGAHEGNPIVSWAIAGPMVAVAKIVVCGSLIGGAILARRWRRRVTLVSLCAAWAVVGVYFVVVLLNTINVVSRV